jgi:thiamine biosynthesis lipoprotein
MTTVTLALHAMATRFELVLPGEEPGRLRAAGELALAEIERLEAQLSLFRPASELSLINARAAREPVRVSMELFSLLLLARTLHDETGGAFDITIGPLMRCWGFRDGAGRVPSTEELTDVREHVGMHLVQLDPSTSTVRFAAEGVKIDLGAIGKGYAIDRAVDLLRESGIACALLHGGTSTVYGLGHPPDTDAWKIAIEDPRRRLEQGMLGATVEEDTDTRAPTAPFATVVLKDEALSVSAIWGRVLEVDGHRYGHILDPRTGQPAMGAVLAAVALPSATETDALSTALLTLGPDGHEQIVALRPGIRTLVVGQDGERTESNGIIPE